MVRLIGAVGARLFYALSALSAYFSARGSSYQRVHELVDAARNRLQAYGLVGGSLVPLSPPSRRDGGFGVVASVSGNAVTLAAGSTLTSGRVRLWDKSGGVYLDAGGVEGRVSGLTVYLADVTGLAAGDVIHADRLEVTSYAAAVALETALGVGFNGEIRVVNSSTGAGILRRIVRSGAWTSVEVNFAAVTATPTGAAASVAGSVVTVTAPHTLATLAKVLRVQVVTDGTWSDVASGQWSVSGDDVTVPQATADAIAAALGASKTVRLHVEGVSELCIGASPCAIVPAAGGFAYFAAGNLKTRGPGYSPCSVLGAFGSMLRASWTVSDSSPTDGSAAGVGARETAVGARICIPAYGRATGADKDKLISGTLAAPVINNAGSTHTGTVTGSLYARVRWLALAAHYQCGGVNSTTSPGAFQTGAMWTTASNPCWTSIPGGAETIDLSISGWSVL